MNLALRLYALIHVFNAIKIGCALEMRIKRIFAVQIRHVSVSREVRDLNGLNLPHLPHCVCEKQRLLRVCVDAQARLSICCWLMR